MEEDEVKRAYYVKIDNISVPESKNATKIIKASDIKELMAKVCEYYGFMEKNIQLWSGPFGYTNRKRLDTLSAIPDNYEYIWVRGIARNSVE